MEINRVALEAVLEDNIKKKILLVTLLTLSTLNAEVTFWDKMKEKANSSWEKTKEVATDAQKSETGQKVQQTAKESWETTKEVANEASESETGQKIKETASKTWDTTKEYSSKAWDATKEKYKEINKENNEPKKTKPTY